MISFSFIVLIALFLCSAFFSATEVALFSLSRVQRRKIKQQDPKSAEMIETLLARPRELLITLLVGNEIVNISISALIASSITANWVDGAHTLPAWIQIPEWGLQTILSILITTPLVLFVCELTPKVIASRANTLVARTNIRLMTAFHKVFIPIRWIFRERKRSIPIPVQEVPIAEEDVLLIAEESVREGTLGAPGLQWIRNIFALNDTKVKDAYTPLRFAMTVVDAQKVSDVMSLLTKAEYTRIPVLSKNKSAVIGVLNLKDLLPALTDKAFAKRDLNSFVRTPVFLQENQNLLTAFKRMRHMKTQLAIVVDNQKRPLGVLSMSDIFGRIIDTTQPVPVPQEMEEESDGV